MSRSLPGSPNKLLYSSSNRNWKFQLNTNGTSNSYPDSNSDSNSEVRRCRLTVLKPELKARLVSALETKM